jgi:uncharacterized protein
MTSTSVSGSTSPRVRALSLALLLAAAAAAATLLAAVLLGWLAPGLEPLQQRLIAVLLLAGAAAGVVAATNPDILTSGQLRWRLLAVPGAVALAPFAAGIKDPGPAATAVIVAGYLATGIYEELWFRGMVLKALSSWTPLRAALLSSALFGLMHLCNIAFGADPATTAAQVIGAACFGVGLAALRLRGMTMWPLVLLHALGDIALQLGDVSAAWRWGIMIGGDTVLLVFGLLLLRPRPASPEGNRAANPEGSGTESRSANRQRRAAGA